MRELIVDRRNPRDLQRNVPAADETGLEMIVLASIRDESSKRPT